MNTFIDRQLAQVYYQEALQEAAEARAYRKARMADLQKGGREFRFARPAAAPEYGLQTHPFRVVITYPVGNLAKGVSHENN